MPQNLIPQDYKKFLEQLKQKVLTTRLQAARSVNKELIELYHHIGSEILQRQKQKGWGAKVIDRLSHDLCEAFPDMKGFSITNLRYMKIFAENYSESEIRQQLANELPWFHIVVLLRRIKNKEERNFYIKKAVENGWSRNVMVMQIETDLYSRAGKTINNFKKHLTPPQSDLANQTLKDPYIFDFLSIGEEAHEREIEKSLIQHVEKFLLELGEGFAFVGRQHHIEISEKDFYLDLLFYHLKLRCFVVVDLKSGDFKPEYAGKMNFYLSAVDDLLKHPSDNPSIGMVLCKSKDNILADYALRDISKPIGLSEFRLTKILPKNIKTFLPTIEDLESELKKMTRKKK
jgi:predicted nuclease of restriction endonuclease-like (RecB) superfamily